MPLTRKTARAPESLPSQEEEEPGAKRPRLEPDEAEPMEPGRPYQAFVESKLRQYLQDNNIRSLTKPTQQEIRAAAMPVLCAALRRREGRNEYPDPVRAHHAVGGMIQHALETGRIKPPFSEACESPNALIKLADEDWIARENHPPPHHHPIYYTMDSESSRPIPSDSYLRGDYVYTPVPCHRFRSNLSIGHARI